MPFTFTEDSLNANIGSFWATYMQEISRQGDLLRESEVVPLCRRLGIGLVWRAKDGSYDFYSKETSVYDSPDADFRRICRLLAVKVPGTKYELSAFVGDVEIGGD